MLVFAKLGESPPLWSKAQPKKEYIQRADRNFYRGHVESARNAQSREHYCSRMKSHDRSWSREMRITRRKAGPPFVSSVRLYGMAEQGG